MKLERKPEPKALTQRRVSLDIVRRVFEWSTFRGCWVCVQAHIFHADPDRRER